MPALVFLLGVIMGTGCAGHQSDVERPRINIANVMPKEIKVFEQVFDLDLRIQNRSDSDLVISGVAFDLEVNDCPFAAGVSNQHLTIARLSSDVVRVQAFTSTWDLLRQVSEAQRTGLPRVKYHLKGTIFVDSPTVKLRFHETGEIEIPVDRPKP